MSSFCLSQPNLLFSELCYWSLTSEAATLNCDILSKEETIGLVGHLGLDKNHMTGLFSFFLLPLCFFPVILQYMNVGGLLVIYLFDLTFSRVTVFPPLVHSYLFLSASADCLELQ